MFAACGLKALGVMQKDVVPEEPRFLLLDEVEEPFVGSRRSLLGQLLEEPPVAGGLGRDPNDSTRIRAHRVFFVKRVLSESC